MDCQAWNLTILFWQLRKQGVNVTTEVEWGACDRLPDGSWRLSIRVVDPMTPVMAEA